MADVYDFSETFQEKILSMLWRDSSFYVLYKEVIKPKYFERDIHMDLARILFDYYEKYDSSPSLEAMLEEVRVLCSGSKVKKEMISEYIQAVDNMIELDLGDIAYVRDKAVTFGQKQALTNAILESVDDINKGNDFDKVKARVDEASRVGQDLDDFGTDYFDTVDERMEGYTKREEEKIKTGVDLLDQVMTGGLGRGELGIVIAPPGTGKTLSLINFGYSAIMEGKNVVHFSFEMNEERVSQRYDSRFTEKTFSEIKESKDKVGSALKRLAQAKRGRLMIKSYPTRTATIDMLKSYITKIKIANDFVPDLIILDYPDIMRSTREYGEKRHEIEMLYEDCRALGQEFNCGVWGASQTNRGALSKKVVTIADLAEAFGKAAVADFMIALSQTKEEKRNGEVRYYVAKQRDGESDKTIHCDIYYNIMKIESNAERETSFDVDEDLSGEYNEGDWKKRQQRVKNVQKGNQDGEQSTMKAVINKLKEEKVKG